MRFCYKFSLLNIDRWDDYLHFHQLFIREAPVLFFRVSLFFGVQKFHPLVAFAHKYFIVSHAVEREYTFLDLEDYSSRWIKGSKKRPENFLYVFPQTFTPPNPALPCIFFPPFLPLAQIHSFCILHLAVCP